jgi:hypothetical protein
VVDDKPLRALIVECQQCLMEHMHVCSHFAFHVWHNDFAASFAGLGDARNPAPGFDAKIANAVPLPFQPRQKTRVHIEMRCADGR